jgi:glycosyltransferase involved in cell wall biosynthesis
VGGARETLVEGENALLVRPEKPEALAAAIRRLLEDRALVRAEAKLVEGGCVLATDSLCREELGDDYVRAKAAAESPEWRL